MKKILLSFAAVVMMMAAPATASAQSANNGQQKQKLSKEQMIEKRSKTMARQLMLDDKTANKFIPIYEQYLKDVMETRGKRSMTGKGDGQKKEELSDEMIEQRINQRFAQSQKLLDIRKSYYDKFRKILTPRQILKIYDTEKNNTGKFRKEMQQRRGGKGQGNMKFGQRKPMLRNGIQKAPATQGKTE